MVAPAAAGCEPEALAACVLDEFRPFLDESLILAILGDFDLDVDIDSARSALSALAAGVEAEEASCFNPSGVLPLAGLEDTPDLQNDVPESSILTDKSRGVSTETTSTAPAESSSGTSSDVQGDIPDDEKLGTLQSMFPKIKEFDVSWELKNAGGDFDKALMALLNIQFLEEIGERQRGIEGAFHHDEDPPRRNKRKGKKKGSSAPDGAKADLRLDISYNLKAPIIDESDSPTAGTSSASSSVPTPSYAGSPAPNPNQQPRPPPLPRDPSEWQTVSLRKKPATASVSSSGMTSPSSSTFLREAASESFSRAHAAWRRGKSDPLHRQVAVVYAERGHGQAAQALDQERADHLARVERQSTATKVDLHGLPVQLGAEIALGRAWSWWEGLGRSGAAETGGLRVAARREPLVIVTGSGNHSAGGVSRLQQAVGVALARDGWSVEAEAGQFVLFGRKKG